MFECWLTINDKILSSSKEATHSYLKGLQTLDFSHFIKISQIHIWNRGLCKNEYKRQRKKEKWKRKCRNEFMDKSPRVKRNPVAPVFENRWHQFLSAAQDIPVTYPVTVSHSLHLPPLSLPRPRTAKGEGEKAISWRFEDSTKDFKAWDKISVLQLSWTGFPSIPRLQ
jgi:hypothetical protein